MTFVVTKVRSLLLPFKLLKDRYFGEAARNPAAAINRLDKLSEQLPPAVVAVAQAALPVLIDFQDPNYALLYLDRISRFIGPGSVTPEQLADISRLMMERMVFDDPIRAAQSKLAEAGASPDPDADIVNVYCWDEIVGMLPVAAADPVFDLLDRTGWLSRHVSLRFSSSTTWAIGRLKAIAALRYARGYSRRFATEKALVERWLHMIERAHQKQPAITDDVIASADMIQGHGDRYHRGVANWTRLIDQLVKPACDGTSQRADLVEAVGRVRSTALDDVADRQLGAPS
jgi:hypothetical protein